MDHLIILGLQAAVGTANSVTPLPTISYEVIFTWILNFFFDLGGANSQETIARGLFLVKFFAVFLSLLFLIGIVYARVMMIEVEKKVEHKMKPKQEVTADGLKGEKWRRVTEHAGSANENDWRLAVLEADIMLDDMLQEMGAMGETLGERLKSTGATHLPSIQSAWEAHLVRNRIAHEGADFSLSQHETRRVIALYETVLKEGGFI